MRIKFYKWLPIAVAIVFLGFVSCQKDESFFSDSSTSSLNGSVSIDGTIYETLENRGNFTDYLSCLDRTDYAEGLSLGSSWTVFAPTDSAFEVYLSKHGYSSVKDLPIDTVKTIVEYSIVTSSYNTTTLTYYTKGWYEGNAFRRTTHNTDTIVEVDSKDYPNFQDWEDRTYLIEPKNGATMKNAYWLPAYMDYRGVTEADYDFMFPGMKYENSDVEMKVEDANVLEANVTTTNGMIYILDKVLTPRDNIYQHFTSNENTESYSIFKNMIDRFGYFKFNRVEVNELTGESDSIWRIAFNTGIINNYPAFDPNSDSYPKLKANINYDLCYAVGMLAPTDKALTSYLEDKSNLLSRYYDSYDDMPDDVVGILINMFFIADYWDCCPDHYGELFNIDYETLDMTESDVVEKSWCSNGLFVGIDKVFTPTDFSTVYGPLVLDTTYTIFNKMVSNLSYGSGLQSSGTSLSVLGIKNSQFVDIPDPNSIYRRITVTGWEPDLSVIYMKVTGDPTAAYNRTYPDPDVDTPSSDDISYVTTTLEAIIKNQIIDSSIDSTENNYYQTRSGEFIYYLSDNNSFEGGGNMDEGSIVGIDSKIYSDNGIFYNMNGPVITPTKYVYAALEDNYSTFSDFIEIMEACDALTAIVDYDYDYLMSFLNYDNSYTLFAPNNKSIEQAISDGEIPDPSTISSMDAVEEANAKATLLNFVKRHFIQQAMPTDGNDYGIQSSMYVEKIVDYANVYESFKIINNGINGGIEIYSEDGSTLLAKTGNIINSLSKKVVIHEIDGYLK